MPLFPLLSTFAFFDGGMLKPVRLMLQRPLAATRTMCGVCGITSRSRVARVELELGVELRSAHHGFNSARPLVGYAITYAIGDIVYGTPRLSGNTRPYAADKGSRRDGRGGRGAAHGAVALW